MSGASRIAVKSQSQNHPDTTRKATEVATRDLRRHRDTISQSPSERAEKSGEAMCCTVPRTTPRRNGRFDKGRETHQT